MKTDNIKHAIDHGLADVQMNEFQRMKMIREITTKECDSNMTKQTKRKINFAVIAVAAMLLMTTVALAGQELGWWSDWNGEKTAEVIPVTATTAPPDGVGRSLAALSMELLKDIPDGEYWTLTDVEAKQSHGEYGRVGKTVETLEELADVFADKPVLTPVLPEGCNVQNMELNYDMRTLAAHSMLYDTEKKDGCILARYRMPEATDSELQGYYVDMISADGKKIYIDVIARPASITNDEDGEEIGQFLISEGEQVEAIQVAGFDKALKITRANGDYSVEMQINEQDGMRINYYVFAQCDVDMEALFAK